VLSIEASGVTKGFGDVRALEDVALTVNRGELVGLVGRNGAGKSVLLRALAGAVTVDAGTVRIEGHDVVAERRAAAASTGVMFGGRQGWYGRLSGSDNLEFFAAVRGLERRAARAEAQRQLEVVGLAAAGGRRVDTYSTGMVARLALARARLGDPPVLLLDEPSTALDAEAASEFHEHLAHADRHRAVVIATHDERELALTDRHVRLESGRVAA
jgi:ABC-type multidrug transport system ATPase subunit